MKTKINFIKTSIVLIAISAALTITSCKKDSVPEVKEDSIKVTITIDKPTDKQVFYLGDTIKFHIMIKADKEIHGYEINVQNLHSEEIVWNKHAHDHGKMFHADGFWVNDVKNHTNVELTVDAKINDSGKKETKIRVFHCMPMKK